MRKRLQVVDPDIGHRALVDIAVTGAVGGVWNGETWRARRSGRLVGRGAQFWCNEMKNAVTETSGE